MKTKLLLLFALMLLSLAPSNLSAASVTFIEDGASSGTTIPFFYNSDGIATFLGSATQEVTNSSLDTQTPLSSEVTIFLGQNGLDTKMYNFYKNSDVDGAPPILDFQLDTYQIAGFLGGGTGIAPSGYLVIGGSGWTQVYQSTSPTYLSLFATDSGGGAGGGTPTGGSNDPTSGGAGGGTGGGTPTGGSNDPIFDPAVGSVPGAPAPPVTLLAAFGLAALARSRKFTAK